MGGGLVIRRAQPAEFAECAALYLKVLRETFVWLPPETHREDDFLRSTATEEIYVARQDGRLAGLAGFYRPQSFLHSLYVEDRGRGVGKALLDHVGRTAEGRLSLKVQAKNLRARAFYAREGFRETERGSDPGGVDWIMLVREGRPD